MNQKHLWFLIIIVVALAFSITALIPPTGRDLLQDFQAKARNKDAAFSNIVAQAQLMQKELPGRAYGNLKEAAGTNDITKYFPSINVKGQKDPSRYVLNRLQRDAAGKIKLGLDLQGGTSFLVGMNTTNLSTNTQRSGPR